MRGQKIFSFCIINKLDPALDRDCTYTIPWGPESKLIVWNVTKLCTKIVSVIIGFSSWKTKALYCAVLSVCSGYIVDPNAIQGTGSPRVGSVGGRPSEAKSIAISTTQQQIHRDAEKKLSQKSSRIKSSKVSPSCVEMVTIADCRDWATGVLMGWESRCGVNSRKIQSRVRDRTDSDNVQRSLTCTCGQGKWGLASLWSRNELLLKSETL